MSKQRCPVSIKLRLFARRSKKNPCRTNKSLVKSRVSSIRYEPCRGRGEGPDRVNSLRIDATIMRSLIEHSGKTFHSGVALHGVGSPKAMVGERSEEHTSEL